jgi:hypothetical protein
VNHFNMSYSYTRRFLSNFKSSRLCPSRRPVHRLLRGA